jgi:hypothetical protein
LRESSLTKEKLKPEQIVVKFSFSERKHLPAIKVGKVSYPIWKFRYAKRIGNMISALCLDEWGKAIIYSEFDQFEKYYLPPFSLKDKTVLDVGACLVRPLTFTFNMTLKK